MFNNVSPTTKILEIQNLELPSTDQKPILEVIAAPKTPRPLAPPCIQIREALQKRGELGPNGLLTKELGELPPIRDSARLVYLLDKNLDLINKLEKKILSLEQRQLLQEAKQACLEVVECVDVLLKGSTGAYVSYMEDYFLEGLTKLECHDLVDWAKSLEPIAEPDDTDWLLEVSDPLDIKTLIRFRTKLISYFEKLTHLRFKEVEEQAFIGLCIPTKRDRKSPERTLANEILISSFGNAATKDPRKTDLVIGKQRCPHLFVKDDWGIESNPHLNFSEEKIEIIPKTSSKNRYQPSFDKVLKMLHLDNPEKVNLEGLVTILIYRSRGESYFPISGYPVLKKIV